MRCALGGTCALVLIYTITSMLMTGVWCAWGGRGSCVCWCDLDDYLNLHDRCVVCLCECFSSEGMFFYVVDCIRRSVCVCACVMCVCVCVCVCGWV